MKQSALLIGMLLFSATALANVYKCHTPQGIKYTDHPCAANGAAGSMPAPPLHIPQGKGPTLARADIHDVGAVPLADPQTQRALYQEFLAHPNPRAFAICQDGGAMTIGGDADFVQKQLSDMGTKCRAYAVNDQVVW